MFWLIKKIFIRLLTCLVNGYNHTRGISWSNQKCQIQPTLTNLHPNKQSQEFQYYSFAIKLERCAGICNNLNDLSSKVCIPNKTEDLNLSVFNLITRINESKILTEHTSCKYICKTDGIQFNVTINVAASLKSLIYVKENMFRILIHVFLIMENIQQMLWIIKQFCTMKLQKKQLQPLLMTRKQPGKRKIPIVHLHF